MSKVFCCSSLTPYRARRLDHEAKFEAFMSWAFVETTSSSPVADHSAVSNAPYAIQTVKQINYGPQESVRYFIATGNNDEFVEAAEDSLLNFNFEKVNSYKNFKCNQHNRFFEINLYQKNPTNAHHWRADLARPARNIDLAFRGQNVDQ